MALWGGRFSQDAKSCVQEYTESISFDKRLFRHDIAGSKAHAAMLGATGIIPKKSSKAIIAELGKIEKMIEAGKMELVPAPYSLGTMLNTLYISAQSVPLS